MYTLWVVCVVSLIVVPIITYFVLSKMWHHLNKDNLVFGSFLSFIIVFLFFLIVGIVSDSVIKKFGDPVIETLPIYSLDRGSNTSGSFFLGTGVTDTSPVYFYYYEVDNDSYQLGRSDAMKVMLTMDSEQTPHLNFYNEICWRNMCTSSYGETRMVVPENTIKKKFEAN